MAIDDVIRVTATFTTPGSNVAQWVWHYKQVAGSTIDFSLMADEVEDMLETAWLDIESEIVDEVSMNELQLALWDDVNNQFDTQHTRAITTIDGSATPDMLPHQDAGLVKFFTDVGRSVGKKFIIGLAETLATDSTFTAATLTALALFAADFDNEIVEGVRRYRPGNFNVSAELFREWSGTVEANALVASMDKRRPGIGI